MHKKHDIFELEGTKAGQAFLRYTNAFIRKIPLSDDRFERQQIAKASASAFQTYYQHSLELAIDKYGALREEHEENEAESGNACDKCCCNKCSKRDTCTVFEPSDGITPPPCAACKYVGQITMCDECECARDEYD
jgi:hypothetical protein